jgi:hypothetical protein
LFDTYSGNQLFRKLVEANKAYYISTPRREKPAIAKALVNQWRCLNPPGRFLAKRSIPGNSKMLWYEIGDDAARKRASKSLGEKKGSPFLATCLERSQSSGSSSTSTASDGFNQGTSEVSQHGASQQHTTPDAPFEVNLLSQQQQDCNEALLRNARALQLAFQTQNRASIHQGTSKESTHLHASKPCMNLPCERACQDNIGAKVVRNQQQLFTSVSPQNLNDAFGVYEATEANSGIGSKIPTAADLLRFCLGDGLLFNKAVVDPDQEYARMEPTHMASESFEAAVMSGQTSN